MTRQRQPCGTPAAYNRHYKARETPCEPCKQAWAEYTTERRGGPRTLKPCGTNAAYERHIKLGQPADQACRDAHNEYMRAWKRADRRKQREARAASC